MMFFPVSRAAVKNIAGIYKDADFPKMESASFFVLRQKMYKTQATHIDMKHKVMSGGEICEGTAGRTGRYAGTVYDRDWRDRAADCGKVRREQVDRS